MELSWLVPLVAAPWVWRRAEEALGVVRLSVMYRNEVHELRFGRDAAAQFASLITRIKLELGCGRPADFLVVADDHDRLVDVSQGVPSGIYSATLSPFVTCLSWLIADADSGRVICSHSSGLVTPPASLTKIMTLHVILSLFDNDEGVLRSHAVQISRCAALVKNGTHADLMEGYVFSLYELLYGMMLPSGNDAAYALAEYVGSYVLKLEGATNVTNSLGYDRFIALMNEKAQSLGMVSTHYSNPHGMGAGGHLSSARDILALVKQATRSEVFLRITGTIRYKSSVQKKFRLGNLTWYNTHELLGIHGFENGKTGWIGHGNLVYGNLWSRVRRGGTAIDVVTMNSPRKSLRFVDSSALVTWFFDEVAPLYRSSPG